MILFGTLVAVNPLAWWFFADAVSSTTHRLMGWFAFGIAMAITLWMLDEGVKLALARFDNSDG